MDREEIIRMAREAGWSGIYTQWREPDGSPDWTPVKESLTVPVTMEQIERFAALVAAAEREKVAAWMIQRSYATGHGDTTEDLLKELEWQIAENWIKALVKGVEGEREACAKVCEDRPTGTAFDKGQACADAIRARGNI